MNKREIGITKEATSNPRITLVHNTFSDRGLQTITQKFYEITSPVTGIVHSCDSWMRANEMALAADCGQPINVDDAIVAVGRGL